jgi:ABC-2 type transport system ATP-binding protein
MIRTEELSKNFGQVRAVDGVSLEVAPGEIFGLVGPDGAGKTTLFRMICGLVAPDAGRVFLQGKSGKESLQAREALGYMPQRFSLYGDLTVAENIDFFGALYSLDRRTIRERSEEVLRITRLEGFEQRLADQLSGGMKQKLALTVSLITRPSVLVLDEPTYGVDPESRQEFWKILYQLNREGLTVLVSTPYMDEAELCHRLAFINQGRVVACGTPDDLRRRFPYHLLEVRSALRDPHFFDNLPQVAVSSFYGDRYRLLVDDLEQAGAAVSQRLAAEGVTASLQPAAPSMEDLYTALAEMGVER